MRIRAVYWLLLVVAGFLVGYYLEWPGTTPEPALPPFESDLAQANGATTEAATSSPVAEVAAAPAPDNAPLAAQRETGDSPLTPTPAGFPPERSDRASASSLLLRRRRKDKSGPAACPTVTVNFMVAFPWNTPANRNFVETAVMARQFNRTARPRLAPLYFLALAFLAAPVAAQDIPYSQGRLWRVEAPNAAPSWLLGTMHSADPEIATPWPALSRVMDGVDSITIELVLDDAANAAMGQAMMLTDGRRLGAIAGPERMGRIGTIGAAYGLPAAALQQFQPWAVNMIFSMPPSELQRQAAGQQMLDNVLRDHAEARGIALYAIETVEEQISLFADYSDADQLALLDMTLDMHGEVEVQFNQLRGAWLAGDLGALYDSAMDLPATDSPGLVDDFMTRLIQERNRRMADRIAPVLNEGNALIAVGALHLPGEEGVLALLEQAGYVVSPAE